MKTILVLRHAKSDWNAASGSDHERPLNARGRRAAECMGRFLARVGRVPDGVVSSSAVRARTTVDLASEAGDWGRPILSEPALYETHPDGVLALARTLTDEWASVLLAGHEPTSSAFTGRCVGAASLRFPTAALARIDFDVESWSQVDFGRGRLIFFVTPKLVAKLDA